MRVPPVPQATPGAAQAPSLWYLCSFASDSRKGEASRTTRKCPQTSIFWIGGFRLYDGSRGMCRQKCGEPFHRHPEHMLENAAHRAGVRCNKHVLDVTPEQVAPERQYAPIKIE